jgi:AraC-like DNA-binding protein
MRGDPEYPPIEGSLIQGVQLVDRLTRPTTCAFGAPSLPGHLIHYVVEGEVEQDASGQQQRLCPGTIVWYYENEAVHGRIVKAPWIWYTVNFTAMRLAPPPFDQRTWRGSAQVGKRFQLLLDAWRDMDASPVIRHMRVIALLTELLMEMMQTTHAMHRVDPSTHLWWDIEAMAREDLSRPFSLRLLQSLSHRSAKAIVHACHAAVGIPPMKQIKEIRLSYARGLVLHSRLPMTEIALRVGYSRVQELSRDYRKRYGVTPTKDRQEGPDYRIIHASAVHFDIRRESAPSES